MIEVIFRMLDGDNEEIVSIHDWFETLEDASRRARFIKTAYPETMRVVIDAAL